MNTPSPSVLAAFERWRTPLRGAANPEDQTNPFWQWCVQHPVSAYELNELCKGPDSFSAGPCWCFDRLGQTEVLLPDGRKVFIAGEHEDHYDPDFYIYNDVVVIDGDDVRVLGYPIDVFPPTDFHSATVVGKDIFLIGNLGYPEHRDPAKTQVIRLSTVDWSIQRVETNGNVPGWLHDHEATYVEDEHAIVITGGKLCSERITENINDFRLGLNDLIWFRLTDRRWARWLFVRADGQPNKLWEIRTSAWSQLAWPSIKEHLSEPPPDEADEMLNHLRPTAEPWQIEQIADLYNALHDDSVAVEDDHACYRFQVDGVDVRINEDMEDIVMTIEGALPDSVSRAMVDRLRERLSMLEATPYRAVALDT